MTDNLKKRVSILGCGWVGKALAIKLVQKGYEVEGTTTSANKLDYLQSHGIIPFIIDIGNHDTDFSPFFRYWHPNHIDNLKK